MINSEHIYQATTQKLFTLKSFNIIQNYNKQESVSFVPVIFNRKFDESESPSWSAEWYFLIFPHMEVRKNLIHAEE